MGSVSEEPGCSTASSWHDIVGAARKPPEKEERPRKSKPEGQSRQLKCSLCPRDLSNIHDAKSRETHWHNHAGILDSPALLPCPTCYSFFCRDDIKRHIKESHPEADCTVYDDRSFEIVNYTSKTSWLKPFVGEEENEKNQESWIYRKSKFTQCKHLNEKRIDTFKSFLKSKLSESPDDLSLAFLYKTHRATKEWPIQWCCPYCDEEEAAGLMNKFRNDISMRVYALRHMQIHTDEGDELAKLLEKEWKYLQKELREDVTQHFDSSFDLSQKHRSVSYYCRSYSQSIASLALEMVRRGDQNKVPQTMVICLICYNPLFNGPTRHFHTYHPELNVHCEESEFRLVPEIATCLLSRDTFIPTFLSYSKVYRIKEADDSDSSEFWKWRCPIACSDDGHSDDVLEFPSIHLLRLYVLKHIGLFHPTLFHQEFLDREWKLVHNDLKLDVDFKTYSVVDEDDFALDNPNEFCVPFIKKMVASNAIAVEKFKICGFCFWCGPMDQFVDHILQHNYVNTGEKLISNSMAYKLYKNVHKKVDYVAQEIGEPAPKILTKAGRKMVKKLFSTATEDSSQEVIVDETEHQQIEDPIVEVPADEPMEEPAPIADLPTAADIPKGSSAESLLGTDDEEVPPEEEQMDGEKTFQSITSGEIINPDEVDFEDELGGLVIDTDAEEAEDPTKPPVFHEFQEAPESPDVFVDEERRFSRDGTPVVRFPGDSEPVPPVAETPEKMTSLAAIEKSIDAAIEKRKKKVVKSLEFIHEVPSEAEDAGEMEEEVSPRTARRRTAEEALMKTQRQLQSMVDSDSSESPESSESHHDLHNLDLTEDDQDDEGVDEDDEDMSTFVPAGMSGLVTPKTEVVNFLTRRISTASSTVSVPVIDWEAKIRENFDYEGEEPPISESLTQKLEKLRMMKCPFCNKTIKRSRISTAANCDEESVLAHLMMVHAENAGAKVILCRKWYKLSEGKDDPSIIPPIFLLDPKNKTLVCSCCRQFSCDRLYNLRIHFTACVQKTLAPPTPRTTASSTRRTPGKSHGCPLNCGIRWKMSKIYSNEVSEVAHLMSSHFGEKEAYEKAREIDNEHGLGVQTPYVDVTASWARSGEGLKLVCTKCGHEVTRLAELVQHAERKHDRLTCPLGCFVRKIDKVGNDSRELDVVLHVLQHLPDQESVDFLSSDDVKAHAPSFPFDLKESVDNILAEKSKPVVCNHCQHGFDAKGFRAHMQRSNCFDLVSRAAKGMIRLAKKVKKEVVEPTPKRDRGSLKEGHRENGIQCPICNRWFKGNLRYSAQISILIHVLSRHQDRYGEELMAKWKPEELRHQSPHIELLPTLEASKKLAKENFALICAFCEGQFPSMPKFLDHLDSHRELLRYSVLEKPCDGCNMQIPGYCIGEESFYRLAHALEHHVADGVEIDTPIFPDKSLAPFLDGDASLTQSLEKNTGRFCCAQCPFVANSSLSFLHHFHEHHNDNKTQKTTTYTCPVCKKSCPSSGSYGVRVSMLAHFIRCHPKSKEEFITHYGTDWAPKEYPFLDAEKSLDLRKFVCNICEKDYGAINTILRHVGVQHGVLATPIPHSTVRRKRRLTESSESSGMAIKNPKMEVFGEEKVFADENIEDSMDERSTIFDDILASEGEETAFCLPVSQKAVETKKTPIYRQRGGPSPSMLTIDDVDPEDQYAMREDSPPIASFFTPSKSQKSTPITTTPSRATQRRERCLQMFSSSSSKGSITNWLTPASGSNLTPKSVAVVMGGSSTTASTANLEDVLNESLSGTPSSSRRAKDSSSIFAVLPQTHVADVFSPKAPVDVSHVDNIGGFKCTLCHFVGATKRDINTHLRLSHANEISNKKNLDQPRNVLSGCCVCTKVFNNRKALLVHIDEAHKDHPSPYPCTFCSKCFATQARVREHERRQHESALKAPPSGVTCKYCGAVFGTPRNLQEHEKRHQSGKQVI